jgi:membrane-associated phospholipid phosphatase
MNRTDGSDPAAEAMAGKPAALNAAPPAPAAFGSRAIGFFCLKDHTFVDYATQAYLVIVGLLILFFYRGPAELRDSLLAAHVVYLLAIQALIRACARRPGNRVIGFLRHFYPILLYPALYRETGELNRMFVGGYLDGFFIRFEGKLFGCQPSILFMKKLPWLPVSEIFYAAYFSFYLMVAGIGLVLYIQEKRQFWRYVSVVSFLFYGCYLAFIFLPVVGSRVFYVAVPGFDHGQFSFFPLAFPAAVRAGPMYHLESWIYRIEAPGGAFPSSHVAAALCTLYFSWRFIPKIRWIHLVVVILLCAATVYCRYHYLVDVFAGMLTAALLIPLAEWLYRNNSCRPSPSVWDNLADSGKT